MLFTEWKIDDNTEYKLRLTAQNCVKLEKDLGKNPLDVISNITEHNLPKLSDLIRVVHAAMLAFNSGVTLEKVYSIYDTWVESGHSLIDLIPLIVDIYKGAGIIPDRDEQDDSKEEKN